MSFPQHVLPDPSLKFNKSTSSIDVLFLTFFISCLIYIMSDNVFAKKLALRFLSISGQIILLKYKEVMQ